VFFFLLFVVVDVKQTRLWVKVYARCFSLSSFPPFVVWVNFYFEIKSLWEKLMPKLTLLRTILRTCSIQFWNSNAFYSFPRLRGCLFICCIVSSSMLSVLDDSSPGLTLKWR
jgi:hypothetical protein